MGLYHFPSLHSDPPDQKTDTGALLYTSVRDVDFLLPSFFLNVNLKFLLRVQSFGTFGIVFHKGFLSIVP